MTATPQNEPTQQALDAFNLARIRAAQKEAADANETNNTVKNKLRGVFAQTQSQGMNNDAAREAIRLAEAGEEAIEEYLQKHEKVGIYLTYLGKTPTKRQYELFGSPGVGPTPEDERAKREGRAAGFLFDGQPGSNEHDNRYEAGSIKGQMWLAAFRQARSERNAIQSMQPAPTPEGQQSGSGSAPAGDEDGGA